MGRSLPVATLLSDRPLIGESSHSSKAFICSVRPPLNDRYRLGADGRVLGLRWTANDPLRTIETIGILFRSLPTAAID